ncbi:hypothetical protein PG996_004397 [Apiospora saccharicola]|uniref:Transmembrane protein n=1 Tax=Apiospora saccharicola TaxID=335842 RepID=A0ABR1W425_9PEZI
MVVSAYPTADLHLPRRRGDVPYIEDRCYGTCNSAFIKGQVSRDWEDFCETGSAFYDYYHSCLCCVGQYLRDRGSDEKAADYLAVDFAGSLLQCGNDSPYRNVTDPCGVPEHEVVSKVPTPFPTATVELIQAPQDSLSVGVARTVPLRQLRPEMQQMQTSAAAADGGDELEMKVTTQYTPVEHTVTAWVMTTNAEDNYVATVPSTFLTTTMSPLPEPPGMTSPPTEYDEQSTTPAVAAAASPGNPPRLTVSAVAGISVSCTVVFLLLCGWLLLWLHRRRRARREEQVRQEAAKQWEEQLLEGHNGRNHSITSPLSRANTRESFCGGCGGEMIEKAQLHGESAPTREVQGREIAARAPVEVPAEPVELPAESVSGTKTGDGADTKGED